MSNVNNYHEEEVLGKAYDARLMKRLLTYIRPYRWWVLLAVVLLLLGSLFQISFAFIIQIGIDEYIGSGEQAGLLRMALIFLVAVILASGATYAQLYITQWLGQKVLHDIRMQVFAHLQSLRLSYFDKNPVGRLVTRVTSDVNVLNEMFSSGVVTVIGDLFMLALIVGALIYYNWKLALITFVVLPLLILATFLFRAKVRRIYREVRTRVARLNAFVQEHITGIRLLQLFVRENRTFDEFNDI
ncbi:MAG: ABC transporter ATP-binding protein, partial [candidate division Zixibacteria bacterium]|nr:ABC transporter ATP-binding protein [candidate division Zixibacteria bacterium]